MNIVFMIIYILFSCSLTENAYAVESGVTITYSGKGAGEVVFDGTVHAEKGSICSDCHERNGLSLALFEMKKGADVINMRKIEMGKSCGHCHTVSLADTSSCSTCHHK